MKKPAKIKKLVGFLPEPLARLEDMHKRYRRTYTQIIEDLVMGRDRFAPDVEAWIESESQRQSLPREVVIERALFSEMSARKQKALEQAGEVTDAERERVLA